MEQHPYAILTMTAEVAVVGRLINNRKIKMVAADTLYWLAIGMPLAYLCFHVVTYADEQLHVPMTKQALNGVANGVVARLIFTGYSHCSNTLLISSVRPSQTC